MWSRYTLCIYHRRCERRQSYFLPTTRIYSLANYLKWYFPVCFWRFAVHSSVISLRPNSRFCSPLVGSAPSCVIVLCSLAPNPTLGRIVMRRRESVWWRRSVVPSPARHIFFLQIILVDLYAFLIFARHILSKSSKPFWRQCRLV